MRNKFVAIALIMVSCKVWSHGDDKPGPNGGFIKMPAEFHTELVPIPPNQFKIYLLDIDWKNPVVENSKVVVHIERPKKPKQAVNCKTEADYFICQLDNGMNLKKKAFLHVQADRSGKMGNEVTYSIPLKIMKKNSH